MYRLIAIASSLLLLLASSAALTVVDVKPSNGFTNLQLDIDMGPSAVANVCSKSDRMGPTSRGRGASAYGPVETPTKPKNLYIKLPAAKKARVDSPCCSDFPYCGCPKLETLATPKAKKNLYIKLPAAKKARTDGACCADYPYCGCPKLETPKPRFQIIDVGAATKRRPKAAIRKAKELVSATKVTCNCCPDFPYCSCPKL